MSEQIILEDPDHPDEPLAAEIENSNDTTLALAIPNTHVRFEMRRQDPDSPFEGSLGGRYFVFDPGVRDMASRAR